MNSCRSVRLSFARLRSTVALQHTRQPEDTWPAHSLPGTGHRPTSSDGRVLRAPANAGRNCASQSAVALHPARLALICVLAITAMVMWFVCYNRLWDRPSSHRPRGEGPTPQRLHGPHPRHRGDGDVFGALPVHHAGRPIGNRPPVPAVPVRASRHPCRLGPNCVADLLDGHHGRCPRVQLWHRGGCAPSRLQSPRTATTSATRPAKQHPRQLAPTDQEIAPHIDGRPSHCD
jgi:hypothetical protein